MTIYHAIVLFSLLVAACAQMLLKKGATIQWDSFVRQYLNVWVISGYALMMISMVIDVWAVSKGVQVKELSTMESCSYLFVPMLSWLFFGERLTPGKAGAIALILSGVIVFFI